MTSRFVEIVRHFLVPHSDHGSTATLADNNLINMRIARGGGATPEDIQSARLRCDTRKWMLAKMLPKVYGDKITQEHTGKIETTETPAEPRALARAVLAILNAAKLEDKEPQ